MGRRPRPAAFFTAVVVSIGFVGAEMLVLGARVRDYDEGVYWQSFRALARGEPLFRSVFAPQPPGFYFGLLPFYSIGHSLTALRLGVLAFGVIGLVSTYVVASLLAGDLGGLVAVVLTATSPLYLHQSGILQADGPAVALSMVAVGLALTAVRTGGHRREMLAAGCGLVLALAVGIKLLGAVTAVPIAMAFFGDARGRARLVVPAVAGGLLGTVVVLLPAVGSPSAAFDQLVLSHLRAGQATQGNLLANLKVLLFYRQIPLDLLAAVGAVVALRRHDRAIVMPLAWVAASVLAVLVYHPLFPHHLVMLSLALALTAAVGLKDWGRAAVPVGLVLVTAAASVIVGLPDIQLALTPDLHNIEMTAAVRAVSRPGEFWISDNPYAVAAASRDIPGPLVDTSGPRTAAGLLTAGDLEAARLRYDVRWVLVDSFRLDAVPGFRDWLDAHFHVVENLGGRAVIYGG